MSKVKIEKLSEINLSEVLQFEKDNRTYFESFVPSRGDAYYDAEIFREMMDSILHEQEHGQCAMFVIRNKEEELVGRVNLIDIIGEDCKRAEIGCRIGQQHSGNGYATAAIALATKEAFETHGVSLIEAGTAPSNIGSQIALARNGFEFAERIEKMAQVNNQWQDSVQFVKRKRP